jgi:hypothetical protein
LKSWKRMARMQKQIYIVEVRGVEDVRKKRL